MGLEMRTGHIITPIEKPKSREAPLMKAQEWPCIRFSQMDLTQPEPVADFILWLCGIKELGAWNDDSEQLADPERLLESLWSWQGAPRKRMAKLCWQLLVRNKSWEHFHGCFTYDRVWLLEQIADSVCLLSPIQNKFKWVLEGFRERQLEDDFIGQGRWGEEWLLPPKQARYVRAQLKRARPDIVEESSNYEDAVHYYLLPYFELACADDRRVYVGEHVGASARVWIEDRSGKRHPLSHTTFPFRQTPGTGFSWGYFGAGPAELSLSILADSAGGDLEIAERLKLPFIEEILSKVMWPGNLKLSHRRVLKWLQTKKIGERELEQAQIRVDDLKKIHAGKFAEEKERVKKIREMGGLRMQRFDVVPSDFESSLYVDLMNMFERAGWVLHCSHCGQPVACERSPRGNRQRARWLTGKPVYHEQCYSQHRLDKKRSYWAKRSQEPSFRAAEKHRARERRKQKSERKPSLLGITTKRA